MGATVGIISFGLTAFSLTKGTVDGFQTNDFLGVGTSIFINLILR